MKVIKHILSLGLVISIIVTNCFFVFAIEDDEITAPSAILMDPYSGKVLYEKNAHDVRACASITKVMTLLLVMEAIDSGKLSLNDMLSASEHAASMGGSDIWLEPGEVMSVDDLIKATVVASANDAAVVLAEAVAGSESDFVNQMNNKAKELGMNETTFKNCNGLDEEGHLTSAYDVAIMSKELIKHDQIFKYTSIWIDYLRGGKTQIVNTNKLIKSYKGITGLKTGTTNEAGSCISATAKRDGLDLVAVVLGSKTGKDRFKDAQILLDYGFANYMVTKLQLPDDMLMPVKVTNGMDEFVQTEVSMDNKFLIPKGKDKDIKTVVDVDECVEAPVYEGQVLGKVTYMMGDEVLTESDIIAANSVSKMNFSSIFAILLRSMLSL